MPQSTHMEPTGTRFVYRRNALEGETTLDLSPDGIRVARVGGASALVPYEQVGAVRLQFAPTRFAPDLHICSITSQVAFPIEVHSMSYVSIGTFEDCAEEYRAFVEELHRRIAAAGSRAEFTAGGSSMSYALNLVLVALALLLAAWAIGLAGDLSTSWRVVLQFAALVGALPIAGAWFRRNRPRRYDPLAIPDSVLPKEPA